MGTYFKRTRLVQEQIVSVVGSFGCKLLSHTAHTLKKTKWRLEKTRFKKKKTSPVGFLGFLVFWVFLGFWGFLGFFARTRGFLGFFSV